MSLVWMIPALGVSLLTIAVIVQLLEDGGGWRVRRLMASAAGVLMVLEGGWVLLISRTWAGTTATTTAMHGVAMLAAGAGIWAVANYYARRDRFSGRRRIYSSSVNVASAKLNIGASRNS